MRHSATEFWTDSPRFCAMCEAVLASGSHVRFQVRGMSMQPNLLDGDKVVLAPTSTKELRKGEIVLTQSADGLLVHRIIAAEGPDRIVTRGDAGQENDFTAQKVIGRVIEIERDGRKTWTAGPGQSYLDTTRTFARRLKLAAFARIRKLGALGAIVALAFVLGVFVNAAPAAAQTADLQLTQTASAPAIAAGSNYTYTEVVTNNNSSATVTTGTITVYMQTPANTTFQAATGTNWTCTTPAVGNAGPVVCTYNTTLASGATASSLTVTFQVAAGTAAGTTIQGSATVTNSTFVDPVPSNNTSLTSIIVEPAATADLGISMSVSPTPVFVTSTLVYNITVQNLGQASAAINSNVLQDTLPSGANGVTFASITVPSGWSCTTPAVGSSGTVQCSITTAMPAAPAAGSTVSFAITVNSPTSPTTLSNTATVNLSGDPNPANNSATSYTVVQPIACATPGKDGAGGTLTGIVNAYYPPAANGILAAGSTSVTVGAAAGAPAAQTQISSGDLLLIIQMQGTAINNSNASTYGHGVPGDPGAGSTNIGNAGLFEFVTATNTTPVPVTGGTVQFTGTGPTGGLLNTYTSAPATASTSLGTATAASWANGIASFTFPIPLPSALVPSSALTTTGFTPAGYNLTEAPILSVNTTTGVVTVSMTTNPGAETGLGTGSFATVGKQTYQVIRVPQYTSATLSSTLVPLAWNGALTAGGTATNLGGVLAIDVSSQLTLGGTVALDGLGFRGGGGITLRGAATAGDLDTDYVTSSPAALPVIGAKDAPNGSGANASKGEGIAGTPHWVAPVLSTITTTSTAVTTGQSVVEGYIGGSFARGAPGNAGGGGTDGDPVGNPVDTGVGNDQNSGGGAGGNGGTGGQGGYGWDSMAATNSTDGGFGGVAFPASTSALVMGGGGGAGTTNNGSYYISNANNNFDCGATCTGIYSSGGYGGGIAIIHIGSVVGTGTITSNGQSTLSTDKDSTGGGGAGGSILVFANSGGLSGLTVNANGGNAGNAWQIEAPGGFPGQRHGPGGGGGGGVVFLTATPSASSSVAGGANGYTDTVQDSYGATPGQNGVVVTTNIITETPGTQSGAYCASADLAVTNSGSPAIVVAGNNITYTQGVTNNGPMAAVNAVFSEAVPANTVFESLTVPSGWTCTTPAVGATGNINCTDPLVNNGANASFTLVVQVNAGTAQQTQITDVASVTSGTSDPNLANNTATVTTVVGQAGSAHLVVTNSATPNPVQAGNDISYTQTLTNQGPSAAANVSFGEALPANTTFVSMTTPAGWSCTDPPVGSGGTIVCTIASLAAGSTATTFNPVLQVTAGTASGTQITDTANVSSTTNEPDPNTNSASATVVVASAGQADMAVTASVSPNPVLAGNNVTFTQTVTNNGPAAAATDTFTETVPATTGFVSLGVPAGWSCTTPAVGASGNINCTATTDAANNVSTFPLVVKVLQSTAPGTAISVTPTVGSATSDPIPSNNSVTVTTYVTSPTEADVAIVKTASPQPVDQGTNLVYTLQVTNNGPAVAQGVTVTDNLPTSSVTYVSSSATQGSCTTNTISQTTPYPSTLQVSCNIGSVSVGALVLVTINTTANTFSSTTDATNTATVSATTGDPNLTNNSSTVISTIQAATAVQLVSFRALRQPNGSTLLEWKTREEVRNLGFNVYREDATGHHRLNPSLIAGAALILHGSQPQHAAKTYAWIDPQPTPGAVYWLEDVDLGGARLTHGPAEFAQPSSIHVTTAPLLSQINKLAGIGSLAGSSATRKSKLGEFQRPASVPDADVQPVNLENDTAIQISVQQEGWYHVTRAQLVAAGLDPYANARTLQLFAEGIEQPLLILGNQSGPLGPNDAIEFYGTGIDTPYSGTRVYWLVHGRQTGLRIPFTPAGTGGSMPQAFPATAVREDRTTYFAALINSEDQDNFFGAIITNEPTDQELDVVHSVVSNLPVTLDVTLQGVTDAQPHSVSVTFNGTFVGDVNFSNLANYETTFTLDPTLVQDGANIITLTALDGDNDVSLVQSIVLHYAHTFTSDNGVLKMQVAPGSQIHATGFSNANIRVFDVTNPLAIDQLHTTVRADASGFSIDFAVPGSSSASQPHLLFAVADDQLSSPSAMALHARSNLLSWREGAIEVIIAHPDFVANLAPLVRLREEQGISVKVVTIDEIFDAYNYGERSPYAVRAFLQNAVEHWHTHPQFVLFAGRASVDPRNYLGFGDLDFVPTRLIDTAALKTASDDWFTDFNQTGYATIATGRLLITTPGDADLLVSKIVGYEQGLDSGAWNQDVLVVADQDIGANFSQTADSISSTFARSFIVTEILSEQLGPDAARQEILSALGGGQALVNYTGHGSD